MTSFQKFTFTSLLESSHVHALPHYAVKKKNPPEPLKTFHGAVYR